MEFIRLGQIIKTRGLNGEVKCFSLTSFAKQRFKKNTVLSLFNEKTNVRESVTVSSFSEVGDCYFLKFKEWKNIDDAKNHLRWFVEIDKDKAPLPEGYFRFEDVKGCKIIDDSNGNVLGEVVDVLSYAPTKTIKARKDDGKYFYFPLQFKDFVASMDLDKKEMRINVIEGLL